MQLCVPLRIVFCGGVGEVDAIGVGIIVAEIPCGKVDILGLWFELDVTDQFFVRSIWRASGEFGNRCLA